MSKSYLDAGAEVDEDDVVRVGINGFGRIGRNTFRALLNDPRIDLVGINDVMDFEQMEYLGKYDTIMGTLDGLELDGDELTIGGTSVQLHNIQSPTDLPWGEENVDVVFECTGIFRTKEDAGQHLEAGADKVVISAPPKGDKPVPQFVYGVNHDEYDGEDVVSNASCTTNSVSPIAHVLDEEFGINTATLTTVHAYTGSQTLIDAPKGRPAAAGRPPKTSCRPPPARHRRPPRSSRSSTARSTEWRSAFPSRPARSPNSSSTLRTT